MSKNNFKAKKFQSIDKGYLYTEVFLSEQKAKVTFKVSGYFLSVLNTSSNRYIDFDKELDSALEKIKKEEKLSQEINLIYKDNLGFADSTEYPIDQQ